MTSLQVSVLSRAARQDDVMKMRFTNDWLRERIETDPDDSEAGADAAFYCPRCGDPLPQDPAAERAARQAGMCVLCVEAVKNDGHS